jgi:hypothetical protein
LGFLEGRTSCSNAVQMPSSNKSHRVNPRIAFVTGGSPDCKSLNFPKSIFIRTTKT